MNRRKTMVRRSITDDAQPSNVQGSSGGGFARRRDSDYRYVKSKAKRVRFADVNRAPLSNNISDDSSTGFEATRDPQSSGIPKTSEYAFFKKVMEGAIQRNQHSLNKESEQKLKDGRHCYPNILHKEKEKLKKCKTNDYTSKALRKSNMLNCHIGDINLSVQSEKVSLNNQCPFVSPENGRCKSPGMSSRPRISHPKNVTTLDQNLQLSPQVALKFSDSHCLASEVFSAKRQKLRLWAETALSGTENFSSKGYDMVTLLLSRLSPGLNENKGSKHKDNTGCSPVLTESDPSEMRHHQSYRIDLTEPEYETCQSSELPSWSIGTIEIFPVDCPAFASDNCFTKYNANTVSHNEMVDNSHGSKSETTKRLLKHIDSPVHLLFGRSGFTDRYHLMEPDSFYSLDESPKREPQTLLLDWDFDNEKDEPEITLDVECCEDKINSPIATLRDSDFHKSIDTGHNTMTLCSRREPQALLLDWDFDKERDEPEIAINADYCEDKMDLQIVTLRDADLQKSMETGHNTMALCSRREHHALLLDWDFDERDKPEIAINADCCEDKMDLQIVTLRDADLHKSIDTGHNTMALCSSSLFSDHSPHLCVLPDFHSTSLQEELYTRDFGRNLQYNEYAITDPDCLSAEYLDPEEYGYSGNAISYFLDYPWDGPVQVFSEKCHLNSNAFLLPMAPNNSEWNSLLATGFSRRNHSSQHSYRSAYTKLEEAWNLGSSNSTVVDFRGEAFDFYEQPICNFQTSFNRMLGCPLLLKDSICARSEEGTYLGSSNE
ncbi:PREDICTED: uncharacterized protein LOC109161719 [Ipomoea nil]|uniref:uncharacterized protein LOC109161719 n=1 Tax=Ipomoea nil TaxID=35883 RepID=UPI000901611E|nr:PREDICTED: uncharacterized protein LOC109161719 [Ipomoea nil]